MLSHLYMLSLKVISTVCVGASGMDFMIDKEHQSWIIAGALRASRNQMSHSHSNLNVMSLIGKCQTHTGIHIHMHMHTVYCIYTIKHKENVYFLSVILPLLSTLAVPSEQHSIASSLTELPKFKLAFKLAKVTLEYFLRNFTNDCTTATCHSLNTRLYSK